MTEHKYPYRGARCFLIPKRRDIGWQVDMEIDGELIEAIYWNTEASSEEQVLQEATKSATNIIQSRERRAASLQ
jgi:hypothetical protein